MNSHDERSLGRKVLDVLTYEPRTGERVPWYWLLFKHRYARLVWYSLVCFLTTIVYYGWQPFSGMLFKNGAYRWLCPEGYDGLEPCLAQDNAVQNLFQVGMACEFIVGVVAGCLLDYIGPLFCGIVGEICFFVGWLLLIYSGPTFVAYIPAMIFMGGAVNLIAFPALILGDFFPKRAGFAMSLVVACQTGSTGVAPALEAIWGAFPGMSFQELGWSYMTIIIVPCTVIYLLTLPVKRPSLSQRPLVEVPPMDDRNMTEEVAVREPLAPRKTTSGHSLVVAYTDEAPAPATSLGVTLKRQGIASVLRDICTVEMGMFTFYYVLQLLQFGYYPTTVRSQSGVKIADFQGVVMPTQAAWGILFGLAVDHTGTIPLCALLAIMMSTVFALVMIPSVNLQYLTSMLYVISNSYIYTVKYTYCNEVFSPANFGMLIGFIGLMGGLFTLLNIPISNANKYRATYISYICVGFVCLAILAVLFVRQRKGINHKDKRDKGDASDLPTENPGSEA